MKHSGSIIELLMCAKQDFPVQPNEHVSPTGTYIYIQSQMEKIYNIIKPYHTLCIVSPN